MNDNNQNNDLSELLGKIQKEFGKESVVDFDNANLSYESYNSISTGSLGLNHALGIGGIPRGRIVEIYGPESSGKTTLALHLISNIQKSGELAAFIDAENAIDMNYAARIGVDKKSLILSQTSSGEKALQLLDFLIINKKISLIVVDSVAALTPEAELAGEIGDSHVGLQARLMSQALRKISGIMTQNKVTVVFINQLRDKVGGFSFGPSEITTGGRALRYYASVRLEIKRLESLREGTNIIGNKVRVKVVKNKLAAPFKQSDCDILYGVGISKENEIIDYAVKFNFIKKSGAWLSYENYSLGQGKDKARQFLIDNPEIMNILEKSVRERLFVNEKDKLPTDNK